MKRTNLILVLAAILLLCGIASAQGTITSGTGTLTFTASPYAAITITEDGAIRCYLCKSIPVGTNIGTLTDEGRARMFPPRSPIVIGPASSGFLSIGTGVWLDKTEPQKKKYAHAQQQPPKPQSDPAVAPTVYKLNAEASAAWTKINEAEAKLVEQFKLLENQKALLLTGAGVPQADWDRPTVTEASGIVTLPPKPKVAAAKSDKPPGE